MLGSTMAAVSSKSDHTSAVPPIQNPQRIATESASHKTLYMPSRLTTLAQPSSTSIKVVSVPKPDCTIPGLPATTLLLDEKTGQTEAIVNAGELTGLRTAAASALATRILADPLSKKLVVFGSGTQAYYHARLILELFPSIETVHFIVRKLSPRSESLLDRVKAEFRNTSVKSITSENGPEVVKDADIICTCVPSTSPLFASSDLKRGVHINAIGSYTPAMFEFPPSLVSPHNDDDDNNFVDEPKIPTILVDSKVACLHEAGELISSRIGEQDLIEVGELCDGESGKLREDDETRSRLDRLRRGPGRRSLFKCVGVGAMDVAVTRLVVEEARKRNLGTVVDF